MWRCGFDLLVTAEVDREADAFAGGREGWKLEPKSISDFRLRAWNLADYPHPFEFYGGPEVALKPRGRKSIGTQNGCRRRMTPGPCRTVGYASLEGRDRNRWKHKPHAITRMTSRAACIVILKSLWHGADRRVFILLRRQATDRCRAGRAGLCGR